MIHKRARVLRRVCSDSISNIENYDKAVADESSTWDLHHRRELDSDGTRHSREELISQNLYYHRPASELIFLRHDEHCRLHREGNNPWKGRHHSRETKALMSSRQKGHVVTQETREKISRTKKGICPRRKSNDTP